MMIGLWEKFWFCDQINKILTVSNESSLSLCFLLNNFFNVELETVSNLAIPLVHIFWRPYHSWSRYLITGITKLLVSKNRSEYWLLKNYTFLIIMLLHNCNCFEDFNCYTVAHLRQFMRGCSGSTWVAKCRINRKKFSRWHLAAAKIYSFNLRNSKSHNDLYSGFKL